MSEPVDLAALRPPQAAALADSTLEELNRLWAVVRAFSNTAHDVNNALQVIAGNAELLEARDLDPVVRRRVETIRSESGKAAATVNRLLEFSRTARQPVQRVDLWAMVETSVGMRLASLGRARVALAMAREGQVMVPVMAEAGKVQQLVLNLLLAAEDRVAGHPKARIAVSIVAGDTVVLRIEATSDAALDPAREAEETLPAPAGLTRETQLWAAAYLAAGSGALLSADDGAFVVRWPRP